MPPRAKKNLTVLPLDKTNSTGDKSFGRMIRAYRLKAGLEQSQLAAMLNATASRISNWERGQNRPDIADVRRLCDALNMPLTALFGMDAALQQHEEQLLTAYRSLNKKNRRLANQLLNTLAAAQEQETLEEYRALYSHKQEIVGGLAAGFGAPVEDEMSAQSIYLKRTPDFDRADLVFTVNGDSMAPDYPHQSKVYVEKMQPSAIPYGSCVACIVAGTPFIKLYERDGLHSINPQYKTIRVSDDDNCRLWGRVISLIPEEDIAPPDIAAFLSLHEGEDKE